MLHATKWSWNFGSCAKRDLDDLRFTTMFRTGSFVRKAGTSFVTPILVGVSAILLCYAKMKFSRVDIGDES